MEIYNGTILVEKWSIEWLRIYQDIVGTKTLEDTIVCNILYNSIDIESFPVRILMLGIDKTETILREVKNISI